MFLWLIAFWWVAATDPLQQLDISFEQGDYANAVLEAKRYLYQFPTGTERMRARQQLAEAYMRLADWEHARQALFRLLEEFPEIPTRAEIELHIGYTYLAERKYSEAHRHLHRLATSKPGGRIESMAWSLSGWSVLQQRDWYAGIMELRNAANCPDAPGALASLANQIADSILEYANEGQRSPATARRLSMLLPGAGQFYGGRPLEGVGTLLVATAGGYLMVDAIRDERKVDAVGLVLLLGWGYLLNIERAELATRHEVDRRDLAFLQQLQFMVERDGTGFGLRFLLSGSENQ